MNTGSIKPGGIYAGGKSNQRRRVILIWNASDHEIAQVRYAVDDKKPQDVSLKGFARWAKRKVGMAPKGNG